MLIRTYLTATFLVATLAACGGADSSVNDKEATSTYAGLALTAVDRGYTSSSLQWHDFDTDTVTTLTTADSKESGDPWLTVMGGKLFLFNRVTDRLNFRSFDPIKETKGELLTTPGASVGDPHDSEDLAAGRTLLSMNVAGKLVVIDPDKGTELQTVDADFDTGSGPFRPETLYSRQVAGGREIFVLHQGLGNDFITPTGKSQVFVLLDDGTTVTAVDLDADTAKVQGIPLTSTDPLTMYLDGTSLVAVGLCTSAILGTCVASAEAVDMDKRTSSVIYDFSSAGYVGNGTVVGADSGQFYAAVKKGADKLVVKIAPKTKGITETHKFPASSAGCCAIFFDDTAKSLYVGDFDEESNNGNLSVYGADGAKETVTVSGGPYTGQFIAK